jgi:hypothetical protein
VLRASACPALPKIEDLVEQDDQGLAVQDSGADSEDHLYGMEHMEGAMSPGFRQQSHDSKDTIKHDVELWSRA